MDENILISLALRTEWETEGPPDNRPREATLRAVGIDVQPPVTSFMTAQKQHLGAEAPDIAVLTYKRRIKIREAVASAAIQEFRRSTEREPGKQVLVPLDGGVHRPQRPAPETQPAAAAVRMDRLRRPQVDRRPGSVFLRRLQTAGLLPVIQAYRLQPVRGEPPQVDLHILCIVDLDSIQEDAHMFAAETPDIDRLEPAGAAIILYLHSRKAVQYVRDLLRDGRLRIQPDFLGRPQHRTLPFRDDGSRRQRIRLLGPQAPGNGKQNNQSGKTATHYYQMAK